MCREREGGKRERGSRQTDRDRDRAKSELPELDIDSNIISKSQALVEKSDYLGKASLFWKACSEKSQSVLKKSIYL